MAELSKEITQLKEELTWAQVPAESWYAFMVSRAGDTKGKKSYQAHLTKIKKLLKS